MLPSDLLLGIDIQWINLLIGQASKLNGTMIITQPVRQQHEVRKSQDHVLLLSSVAMHNLECNQFCNIRTLASGLKKPRLSTTNTVSSWRATGTGDGLCTMFRYGLLDDLSWVMLLASAIVWGKGWLFSSRLWYRSLGYMYSIWGHKVWAFPRCTGYRCMLLAVGS